MTDEKLLAYIGFALRGHKVAVGDMLFKAFTKKQVALVIVASDCPEKYLKDIESHKVKMVVYGDKKELGCLYKGREINALGILDENLGNAILNRISNMKGGNDV